MPRKAKYENLREACIEEALEIIENDGIEKLSVREVARRLGVSHQAPYKHFPSRDHILAEIVQRCFDDFAQHLDSRPRRDNPHDDLGTMGFAYLQYAAAHPLQYRLMFGTPLPDPNEHPEMMHRAEHAFALLRDGIAAMGLDSDPELDALYVLSTMHGLASILHLQMLQSLPMSDDILAHAARHVIGRIGVGLGRDVPPND